MGKEKQRGWVGKGKKREEEQEGLKGVGGSRRGKGIE